MKVWSVYKLDKERAEEISQYFDIPIFTSMLFSLRNVEYEDIECFMSGEATFEDPFMIADMSVAAERIKGAIESKEKICVYGDYDADGVTATALLYSHLQYLGANVFYDIPSRNGEGYGLNMDAIDSLKSRNTDLIITVDNGISAINEIDRAVELGMDVIVTDHHMPLDVLPAAVANIDPHREDCGSTFKEFSGVGVAFKLVMALSPQIEPARLLDMYADLVCIGTIGDIVSLTGENRALVIEGLKRINNTKRPGLLALKNVCGLTGKDISSSNVSYAIVPRINAIGRLDDSKKSVEMLLTNDRQTAQSIADTLDLQNKERQAIEKDILREAVKIIEADKRLKHSRVIVVDGRGWHAGVIGIVASRLKEMYSKPVIVIARDGELSKGSGRSINGFSLHEAIFSCSQYLEKFGGHPLAAGLTIKEENIEAFRSAINEYAEEQPKMPYDTLSIDCKLSPSGIDINMVRQIKLLEPFGAGNPSPLFGLYNMKIKAIEPVSSNKHLRITLKREETELTAMMFSTSAEEFPYSVGDTVDTAVTLDINEYMYVQSVSLVIKACKYSCAQQEKYIDSYRIYEKFMRAERLTLAEINEIMPTREEFAIVYRAISRLRRWHGAIDVLTAHINGETISCGRLAFILRCMCQLGIIRLSEEGFVYTAELSDIKEKVDLDNAKALIYLKNMLKEIIKKGDGF